MSLDNSTGFFYGRCKMEKEDTGKIQAEENGADGAEKDKFESKYDPIQRRISYKTGFRDHCYEELSFIAGILDLLFLVNEGDQWENRSEEIAFVLMDARDRARELIDVV
jgi:hypothetical protein